MYHYCIKGDNVYWNGLLPLFASNPDQLFVCNVVDYTPAVPYPPVGPAQTALMISGSHYSSGANLANATANILTGAVAPPLNGLTPPACVMWDEIKVNSSDANYNTYNTRMRDAANILRTSYPSLAGRWGAYIQHPPGPTPPVTGEPSTDGYATVTSGSKVGPAQPIDAILQAHGRLASEQYMYHSWWCTARTTTAAADDFLLQFFRGSYAGGKFPAAGLFWLLQRKAYWSSSSKINAVFGVTDTYLNKLNTYKFLDRMFYIFKAHFPGTCAASNGGVGSYKWQHVNDSGTVLIPNASRAGLFKDSWNYYCNAGTTYRYSGTDC